MTLLVLELPRLRRSWRDTGLLAFAWCDDPVAERLRRRTPGFLHARMEYPGVWRYWPRLPPDLDDTAICSLAVKPHFMPTGG